MGYNPPLGSTFDGPGFKAFGASQPSPESSVLSRAMAAIRREVARESAPLDFVIVHSLAGGTGSGLGSRIVEAVRGEWHDACVVSVTVVAGGAGDGPLNSYNTILAAKCLYKCVDGIILFNNRDLVRAMEGAAKPSSSSHRAVSLQQINRYIARCMAGVFIPGFKDGYHRRPSSISSGTRHDDDDAQRHYSRVRQLVDSVCISGNSKFMEVWAFPLADLQSQSRVPPALLRDSNRAPFSSGAASSVSRPHPPPTSGSSGPGTPWRDLIQALGSLIPRFQAGGDGVGSRITSSAALVVLHSPASSSSLSCSSSSSSSRERKEAEEEVRALLSCGGAEHLRGHGSKHHREPLPCQAVTGAVPFLLPWRTTTSAGHRGTGITHKPMTMAKQKGVTIACARSTWVSTLSHALDRGMTMLEMNAYVHWYQKFGCSKEVIEDAALFISNLILNQQRG